MSELFLFILVLVVLAFHVIQSHQASKEREKFINAFIAKNAAELRDLELTAKVEPIKPQIALEPQVVEVSDLSDEDFDKNILGKEIS